MEVVVLHGTLRWSRPLSGERTLRLRRRCRASLLRILGRRLRVTCRPSLRLVTAIPLVKLVLTILPRILSCPLIGRLLTEPEARMVALLLARLQIRLVAIPLDRMASACVLPLMTRLREVRYLRYPLPEKQIGESTSLPQAWVGLASCGWSISGATIARRPRRMLVRRVGRIGRLVPHPQQKLQLFDRNLFGPTCLLYCLGIMGGFGQNSRLLICCRRKFYRRCGA